MTQPLCLPPTSVASPIHLPEERISAVDNHEVEWNPQTWIASFQRHEPTRQYVPHLSRIQALTTPLAGYPAISRRQILDLAEATRTGKADAIDVHLAGMIWGSGRRRNMGRKISRIKKMMSHPDSKKRIHAVFETVNTVGTLDAFRLLMDKDRLGLPQLGISFATKSLYFFGLESEVEGPRPLILDTIVARRLSNLCRAFPRYPSPRRYKDYLQLIEAWAVASGVPRRPDVIEFELFI